MNLKCEVYWFLQNLLFKSNLKCNLYRYDEEEQSNLVEVFYKVHASPTVITVTISSLLTMLLVAMQRAFTMMESEGWSYGGNMGAFERL